MHPKTPSGKSPLDALAERYVRLALMVGLYNEDYIDAYFGPSEWKPAPISVNTTAFPYEKFRSEATALIDEMTTLEQAAANLSQQRRWRFLNEQIKSMAAMIDILGGRKMTFDEESEALYGTVAPHHDSRYYDNILKNLDTLVPGTGDIHERMTRFRNRFLIPGDTIGAIMKTAIADCRELTRKHIQLPGEESFTVELVTDQPWTAYNLYKGDFVSLIQINTSDEIRLADIITLAAHEGYPGHHVQNVLQEGIFYRDNGWVEFCVQPLLSPINMIMEGAANFAEKILFPVGEWAAYMIDVICPLVGIEPSDIDTYYSLIQAGKARQFAEIDGARQYLDGHWSREETIRWLMHYLFMSRNEAGNSVEFYDRYRAYIINYSVGESLVEDYIESHGGTSDHPQRRWESVYRSADRSDHGCGLIRFTLAGIELPHPELISGSSRYLSFSTSYPSFSSWAITPSSPTRWATPTSTNSVSGETMYSWSFGIQFMFRSTSTALNSLGN